MSVRNARAIHGATSMAENDNLQGLYALDYFLNGLLRVVLMLF